MKKIALCLHGAMSLKESDFNNGYKNSYVNHDYIEYREDINDFVNFSENNFVNRLRSSVLNL